MRITFESHGGVAFFPGLNRPVLIDTAQLPAEERSKLEGLIQSSRFFTLPGSVGKRPRVGADLREYTLRVEDGKRDYRVRVAEPLDDPKLAQLITELRSRARANAVSRTAKGS
jgi:hypothetical protein